MIRALVVTFGAMMLMAAAPLQAPAPPSKPLIPVPDAAYLVGNAPLSGDTAYLVFDLDTGQPLEAGNLDLPLPPASAAKAPTAIFALDRLGAGYRFETRLSTVGKIVGGVLKGDLILQGGGDPELDSVGLDTLANDLALSGIRQVDGRFLVDESLYPPIERIDDTQPEVASYNPAVSALSLNFNRVFLEWRRASGGYNVRVEARATDLSPLTSAAVVEVVDETISGGAFDYVDASRVELWRVRRSALGKRGNRFLPVRRPALYAGQVFRDLARDRGVRLPRPEIGAAPTISNVLARKESRSLTEITRDMLKYSTNLTAEALGLAATRSGGNAASNLAASAGAMNAWTSAFVGAVPGDPGLALVNHSGLSGNSRMTVRRMVEVLAAADLRGFPALNGGQATTLFALMKQIGVEVKDKPSPRYPYVIRAKTGTLNFTSALAGYIQTEGRRLAFAIFSADLAKRAAYNDPSIERPRGSRTWGAVARNLQRELLRSWINRYGGPR